MDRNKDPKFKYLQVPGMYHGQVGQLGTQVQTGIPTQGSHLLLSPCQSSQAELEVSQTFTGNIVISLHMVSIDTVLANETFLQKFRLAASGLQALQGPRTLFCMTLRATHQLACDPSIQKSVWTPGKMVIKSLRPPSDCRLCSSQVTVSADASVPAENRWEC